MKKNSRFVILFLSVLTVTNLLATYYSNKGNKSSIHECNEMSYCDPLAWEYCDWWCSTMVPPRTCFDAFYVYDKCDWDTHYCQTWYTLLCSGGQMYRGWLCEKFSWDCVPKR